MSEISKQRSFPISLDSYLTCYNEITCSFQILVALSKAWDDTFTPGRSQVQSVSLQAGTGEVSVRVVE